MKKILVIALIFVFAFSMLTACTGDRNTPSDSTSDNSDLLDTIDNDTSDNNVTIIPDNSNDNDTEPTSSDNGDDTETTDTEISDSDDTESTDTETTEDSEGRIRPPASPDLSSEWNSFQFELEGVIYTLPVLYSELEENGWTLSRSEYLEETLESNQFIVSYLTLVYNDKKKTEISAEFSNLSNEEKTLAECYVTTIQYRENQWTENTDIYLPGGITIGSTMEEVEALYGEPGTIRENSTTIDWQYDLQIYDGVDLTFTTETGKVEKMRISNKYLP